MLDAHEYSSKPGSSEMIKRARTLSENFFVRGILLKRGGTTQVNDSCHHGRVRLSEGKRLLYMAELAWIQNFRYITKAPGVLQDPVDESPCRQGSIQFSLKGLVLD
jgi:hypothetical protein